MRLIVQTQAASLRTQVASVETQAASVETQVASEEFGRMRGTLGLDGRKLGRVWKGRHLYSHVDKTKILTGLKIKNPRCSLRKYLLAEKLHHLLQPAPVFLVEGGEAVGVDVEDATDRGGGVE